MKRSCVYCGAPCRFLLCDPCYAKVPSSGAPLFENTQRAPQFVPEVGLPVTVDGVRRF